MLIGLLGRIIGRAGRIVDKGHVDDGGGGDGFALLV